MKNCNWTRKANALISLLQKKANAKGIYENFGQKEIREFEEKMDRDNKISYSEKANVMKILYKVSEITPNN